LTRRARARAKSIHHSFRGGRGWFGVAATGAADRGRWFAAGTPLLLLELLLELLLLLLLLLLSSSAAHAAGTSNNRCPAKGAAAPAMPLVIENRALKIGIDPDRGGAICWLSAGGARECFVCGGVDVLLVCTQRTRSTLHRPLC
jgi:hypothetical protein